VALVMLRTISKMMIMFFSFVWSRDWREMNLYDKKKEAKVENASTSKEKEIAG
jgi:hypothetical protein